MNWILMIINSDNVNTWILFQGKISFESITDWQEQIFRTIKVEIFVKHFW